jgi:multicomponent Na+:H+ antiporter subunit D
MGAMAFLCLALGIYPDPLYNILPYDMGDFTVYHAPKVVAQMQLLMFSALAFFLLLPLLKRTDTIALEIDWVYRRGGKLFFRATAWFFNGLNSVAATFFGWIVSGLAACGRAVPDRVVFLVESLSPDVWFDNRLQPSVRLKRINNAMDSGTFQIGGAMLALTLALAVLLILVL